MPERWFFMFSTSAKTHKLQLQQLNTSRWGNIHHEVVLLKCNGMPPSSHLIPASQDVRTVNLLTRADILCRDTERPQLSAKTLISCEQPLNKYAVNAPDAVLEHVWHLLE